MIDETPTAPRRVSLTLLGELSAFESGRRTSLRLRVENRGTKRLGWPWRPSRLVYRWLWPDETLLSKSARTKRLPRSLAPGGACEIDLRVACPNTTGDFVLEVSVAEGTRRTHLRVVPEPLRIPTSVVRGKMDDFGEYKDVWEKANLDRDYWSIVGPGSRDEFDSLSRMKRNTLVQHGLTPKSRILDVGCGTGCLTQALLEYLDDEGFYFGTDIAPQAIDFCRRRYVRENFRFAVNGSTEVSIDEGDFDFIHLSSVFTHMFPEEIAAMSMDLRPRLRPDGVLIADAFTFQDGPEWSGSRAKVDVRRDVLEAAFDRARLRIDGAEVMVEEGPITRRLYRLRVA